MLQDLEQKLAYSFLEILENTATVISSYNCESQMNNKRFGGSSRSKYRYKVKIGVKKSGMKLHKVGLHVPGYGMEWLIIVTN